MDKDHGSRGDNGTRDHVGGSVDHGSGSKDSGSKDSGKDENPIFNPGDMWVFLLLVCANFLGPILSCGMQNMLTHNIYAKHVVGLMTMFFAIQLTGKAGKNPTSLLASAFVMYLLFIMFSKTHRVVLSIIVLMLFAYGLLSSYKNYYEDENQQPRPTAVKCINISMETIKYAILTLLPIGFVWYIVVKRAEYEKDWNWFRFIFGVTACKFNGS